jgi:acyl dehydratase
VVTFAALRPKIGRAAEPVTIEVEKGQIRRFARAIGESNPIHFDEAAAHAAGFPSLVATPTFLSALHDLEPFCASLGLDLARMMHAEEEYEYNVPICAGDVVTVVHRLADAYEKRVANRGLCFAVIETRASGRGAQAVFKGRRVLVEMQS